MTFKIFLIVLLAVVYTRAQDNDICVCNPEQEQDNVKYWDLLKKLEKMASEVPDDQKKDYASIPGSLYQLGCNCDEKLRKRRDADEEIEHPEEVSNEQQNETAEEEEEEEQEGMEDVREKRSLVKPKYFANDLRCPVDTYWIAAVRSCVPIEYDIASEEQ